MASLFFSYSHKDEELRDRLETQLAMLKRQGVIDSWHDRRIAVGNELDKTIDEHLNVAEVILLLISPDFLASKYCYDVELTRAMERHERKEARVIPVILRPCDWQGASFGKLLVTPPDGKPITKWPDMDEAFLHVVKAIRDAIGQPRVTRERDSSQPPPRQTPSRVDAPRSSNLRLRKNFTEADLDRFLDEAFEYMARYFENSLDELSKRNTGIEGSFKRIDAHRFSAVVYRNGKTDSRCLIRLRGMNDGITYSNPRTDMDGLDSFNESLTVDEGDDGLALKPLGMSFHLAGKVSEHMTFEGAAEFYWSIFIEPLQRR